MAQAAAVDARSILDLRLGAAFTRMQTMSLQNRIPQLGEQKLISYGAFRLSESLRICSHAP